VTCRDVERLSAELAFDKCPDLFVAPGLVDEADRLDPAVAA
jgi:hypothetical protein